MSRASEIRIMVRGQVADALLEDANGMSENLLKETFERCGNKTELEIAYREARRLAKLVRKPVVKRGRRHE